MPGELHWTECILPAVHAGFYRTLAKAGAHGIRVEREDDIQAALDEARTYKDALTIIEFMITDEIKLPMVKSGNPMSEMILK